MSVKAIEWARQVIAPNISSGAVLLYLAACHNDQDGACFPSRQMMATHLNCNIKTIDEALNRLRKAGLIISTKKACPAGVKNFYELNFGYSGVAPKNGSTQKTGVAPNSSEGSTKKRVEGSTQKTGRDKEDDKERIGNSSCQNASLFDEPKRKKSPYPNCPYEKIRDLYAEICTELPECRVLSPSRMATIKARWNFICKTKSFKTEEEGLGYFRQFFTVLVKPSAFLNGHVHQQGRRPFRADLMWLMKEENFIKCLEGKFS